MTLTICLRTLRSFIIRLTFNDNSFDTVVDTFGLEYCINPKKVIDEMRRVCKKDGLILILASGMPSSPYLQYYYRWRQPLLLGKYGKFNTRDWNKIIKSYDFDVINEKRFLNGSVYLYILKNNK